MGWNAGLPANNQSPSLAPAQIRANWDRLFTMISAGHVFNTSVTANDGYHSLAIWSNHTGTIGDNDPAPTAGAGQLYTKTVTTTGTAATAGAGEHLCYQRGTGGGALQEASLSVCPVRAAVNFIADGTIKWAYNVSSVTTSGSGKYQINFSINMPSIYYVPFVSGSRNASNKHLSPTLKSNAALELDKMYVEYYNDSDSQTAISFGTVIVFGG